MAPIQSDKELQYSSWLRTSSGIFWTEDSLLLSGYMSGSSYSLPLGILNILFGIPDQDTKACVSGI